MRGDAYLGLPWVCAAEPQRWLSCGAHSGEQQLVDGGDFLWGMPPMAVKLDVFRECQDNTSAMLLDGAQLIESLGGGRGQVYRCPHEGIAVQYGVMDAAVPTQSSC